MFETPLIATAQQSHFSAQPTLFLDYGADAAAVDDASCEICERGMRFKARWQFSIGTVLHIAFAMETKLPERVEAEAMVIECKAAEDHLYSTTLLFLEPPAALRASLGKISVQLQTAHRSTVVQPA